MAQAKYRQQIRRRRWTAAALLLIPAIALAAPVMPTPYSMSGSTAVFKGGVTATGVLRATRSILGDTGAFGSPWGVVWLGNTNSATPTATNHTLSSDGAQTIINSGGTGASSGGVVRVRAANGDLTITGADSGGRIYFQLGSGGPQIFTGTGSPASVVTAPIGSLFLRSDGSTSTTLYVKESGAGNTGWVAK